MICFKVDRKWNKNVTKNYIPLTWVKLFKKKKLSLETIINITQHEAKPTKNE